LPRLPQTPYQIFSRSAMVAAATDDPNAPRSAGAAQAPRRFRYRNTFGARIVPLTIRLQWQGQLSDAAVDEVARR
jgi:hypothetical protein